jgi:hypothetical protein
VGALTAWITDDNFARLNPTDKFAIAVHHLHHFAHFWAYQWFSLAPTDGHREGARQATDHRCHTSSGFVASRCRSLGTYRVCPDVGEAMKCMNRSGKRVSSIMSGKLVIGPDSTLRSHIVFPAPGFKDLFQQIIQRKSFLLQGQLVGLLIVVIVHSRYSVIIQQRPFVAEILAFPAWLLVRPLPSSPDASCLGGSIKLPSAIHSCS